ncbi:MAG: hypothetical protein DMG05_12870 [Acidobacteria bacterium]|nr:MAG: hypothetical protein DMG05_12870 [Acidobacteriota bacterium]
MKKQVYRSFATFLLLSVIWAAPSLYAQSSRLMTFKIPFHFNIGKTSLPAGDYTVQPLSQTALLIRSDDCRSSAIVLTISAQTSQAREKGTLVFNQYGNRYFLSKVWHPANNLGGELLPSKLERELAQNMSKPQATILTAQKR